MGGNAALKHGSRDKNFTAGLKGGAKRGGCSEKAGSFGRAGSFECSESFGRGNKKASRPWLVGKPDICGGRDGCDYIRLRRSAGLDRFNLQYQYQRGSPIRF